MDMYDLKGNWVGYQLGVHESTSSLEDLLHVPDPPTGPMNQPVGPVPHPPIKEWTKGLWTFADGSEIYAVGQAQSHLVPLSNGDALFMVATGQLIPDGSGRYDGAHGTKQATGTTLVPAALIQAGKFPSPGLQFDARTVETFRIVKKKDMGPIPQPGEEQPPPLGARGQSQPAPGHTGSGRQRSSEQRESGSQRGAARGSDEERDWQGSFGGEQREQSAWPESPRRGRKNE